jgi:hypothetical protein
MKTGLNLQQLAAELDRQNQAKQDFVVDEREVTLLPGVEGESEVSRPSIHLPNGNDYTIKRDAVARRQIGDHLKIPAKFWDHLEDGHQPLLAHTVNTLFRERGDQTRNMMVRAFDFGDGESRIARAFLSDRYLRRDNAQVAEAALKVLKEVPDVRIPSAQITDRYMHITAIAPKVQGEVKVGDVVQAGLRIRNSEVGWGALSVEPILYRLWCDNGCTTGEVTRVFRIVHSGPQIDSDETLRVLSNETLQKDDEAFFAKLADVMRAAVDETIFNDALVQMRLAAESKKMEKPKEAMEELAKTFQIGEGESDSILGHLIEGGDLTAYGALNAVTRTAHDVESYDRAMELEEVGGKILAMAGTPKWDRIATAA